MLSRRWLDSLTSTLDAEFGAAERQRLLAGAEALADATELENTDAEFASWFADFTVRLGQHPERESIKRILQQCCPCAAPNMFAQVQAVWTECATIPQFAAELDRRRVFGKSIAWRDGAILVIKPPICDCGAEYQHDHQGRFAATCHCDMASRLATEVPDAFCACGGGFYQKMFREVWGFNTRVDTVSTVISGGTECVLAIHVPAAFGDIDRAVALYWQTLAQARGLEHRSEGGVSWVASRSGNGPARVYHAELPVPGAADRLSEIRSAITRGELPNGILFTPASSPDNLISLLGEAGFAVDTSSPCMMIDLNAAAPAQRLTDLITIETVATGAPLAEWAAIVNADLFGEELMSSDQFGDLLRLPNVRFYLARYDGAPAATCMTIADGGLATLEMVATRATMRRRGLAAAAVRTAMADLRGAGVKSLHLRAEADAVPFYDALGFRRLGPRIVASIA